MVIVTTNCLVPRLSLRGAAGRPGTNDRPSLRVPREERILRAWSPLSVAVQATVVSHGLPLR